MRRLQLFDYLSSGYLRANRTWVCGHAVDGEPCATGPGPSGRCPRTSECKPVEKEGRWLCTRAATKGGPCKGGPSPTGACGISVPPCVPVRSLRSVRGQLVKLAVVVTLGFLAIVLGSDARKGDMPMPGPLTAAHTAISKCATCHATVHNAGDNWIKAAFMPVDTKAETTKCLACHELPTADANNPHGMAAATLAALTTKAKGRAMTAQPAVFKLQDSLLGGSGLGHGTVACATCHVEHHGANFDLTAVTNNACQTCHTGQFHSLAQGHPEFVNYPFSQRTSIFFDHVAHFNRHFPETKGKAKPTFCTDCHKPGTKENGRFMVEKSFEKTCQACHQDQIDGTSRATGPKGVTVLTIPGIDVYTLRDHGIAIGNWPEDSEAPLTPFLRALLILHGADAADLKRLSTMDLLDLSKASDADLQRVSRLAWAVKSLFHDVATADMSKMATEMAAKGLGNSAGQMADRQLAARLFGNLSRDVIEATIKTWLPNLDKELTEHQAGKTVWGKAGPPKKKKKAAKAAATKKASSAQSDILGGGGAKPDQSSILGGGAPDQSSILGGGSATPDQSSILGGGGAKPDQSSILGGGGAAPDQSSILGGGSAPDQSSILGGAPATGVQAGGALAEPATSSAPAAKPAETRVDAETWASLGGWYRSNYAILYRPVSHADPFLKAWLDFSAESQQSPALGGVAQDLFSTLSGKDAQGQCLKCHTVNKTATGALKVSWGGFDPATANTRTVYTHRPHFALQGSEGCSLCHQLDAKADYAAAYKPGATAKPVSNFKPIQRVTCAQCHTTQVAGDECTTCHRYHWTSVRTPLLMTRLPGAKTADAAVPKDAK